MTEQFLSNLHPRSHDLKYVLSDLKHFEMCHISLDHHKMFIIGQLMKIKVFEFTYFSFKVIISTASILPIVARCHYLNYCLQNLHKGMKFPDM
jgi:hypothetical protein